MGYCGRPRLNGLEVKRINSRNPKAIIPITASTRATASSGIRRLKMATAKVQTLSSRTHSSSEPSCAPGRRYPIPHRQRAVGVFRHVADGKVIDHKGVHQQQEGAADTGE
ncbi:hypothetical protein KPZU09_07550 [Klebsiella pneumoniae]|uniref:Uncharacterized protein n=1 Tax=Klebsiella pneumoniae TaxID=573 RepID=A0A919HRT6_KLEPN|nr:hypothetical protein KPZU09_07550 [Klebsiella pneumoniae]